jgi:hypothetical protein
MISHTKANADPSILHNGMLYENMDEQKQHASTVKSLAEEVAGPVHEVANIYESVLLEYKDNAKIKDYLPVLVSKKVKQLYRDQLKK